jgi:hypothetical protein
MIGLVITIVPIDIRSHSKSSVARTAFQTLRAAAPAYQAMASDTVLFCSVRRAAILDGRKSGLCRPGSARPLRCSSRPDLMSWDRLTWCAHEFDARPAAPVAV